MCYSMIECGDECLIDVGVVSVDSNIDGISVNGHQAGHV